MSPVNSRAKGKRGELQLAHKLTELGYPARRGVQFKGGTDSPDVVCEALKDWHIECKLTKTCQMFSPAQMIAWADQALGDAGGKRPVIIHRWNGARFWWVYVLQPASRGAAYWQPLEDWLSDVSRGKA